ncbi:unnamed protein product [Effrenium voratum]|uniref:OTU domain-containing protein n=1 Tax=Effrenium voratum TaxID=2562239 RepID=A0AA36J148_9DINO|nr:unnamed protein product [Effrenium voratum]
MVTPPGGDRWCMMVLLDFTSNRLWAWDMDEDKKGVGDVQSLLVRWYSEIEVPLVIWSDGSQFRSVLSEAVKLSLGVEPRFIPPGRPQSNGLVEVMNRVLDGSHGGDRSQLMLAVAAHNAMPTRKHGICPEAIWRACRPVESRWKHKTVQSVLGHPPTDLSSEEWDSFLSAHAALTTDDYKQAIATFEAKMQPVQEALQDQHARSALAQQLKYQRKKTRASAMPLLSGDRVIVRASQYRSACGYGKFETDKGGGLKEYVVKSINSSIAQIEELGTGVLGFKHVGMLKALPNSMPSNVADDPGPSPRAKRQLERLPPIGPFFQIAADTDGGCMFRSLAMGLQFLAGVPPHRLEDNDQQVLQLRRSLIAYSERHVRGLPRQELLTLSELAAHELRDDPSWKTSFSWDAFHQYMSEPKRYGTYYWLGTFTRMHSVGVRVYRLQSDALALSWQEQPPGGVGADTRHVSLLRNGLHYDLLVLNMAPAKRMRGKQSA